ncbi:MAG: rhodanese-like domain-containing protein [bacterium]|nr:rhodanese-like domain-containing protein [bacterium]
MTTLCLLAVGLIGCSSQLVGTGDISQEELLSRLNAAQTPLILDVRSDAEFAQSHVPGALNIPHDQMSSRLSEIDSHRDREVVVYCESGRRAGRVTEILNAAGFSNLRHLAGDMSGWRNAELPVDR